MLTKKYPFARVINVARQHSPLAQSVEQRTVNPPVDGSNPSGGARDLGSILGLFLFVLRTLKKASTEAFIVRV